MRFIIFIIFDVFFSMLAYSQLQNRFFDCELGQTSEQHVLKILSLKGYNPFYSHKVLVVNDVIWGGGKWPCVAFYFKNDMLSEVRFMQDEMTSTRASIHGTFDSLKSMLKKKYNQFQIEESDKQIMFEDEDILIILTLYEESSIGVILRYLYIPFIIENIEKGIEDL